MSDNPAAAMPWRFGVSSCPHLPEEGLMFTLTVRRRDLAWATVLIVLLSAIWVARGDRADAGSAPPGQGIAVVYVAVGTNFPDSLGVGPGGGVNGAPIIIVPTDPPIPDATATELVRLDPIRVVIVGGTAVVSTSMQAAIGTLLPNATIERIAGANRYETNAMFSEAVFPVEGWVSIPSTAFTAPDPENATIEINRAYNTTDGRLFAPVLLPHGARVVELRVAGSDTAGGQELGVFLYRTDAGTQIVELAAVSSSGTPGNFTVSTESITPFPGAAVIDNANYGYMVWVDNADLDPFVRMVMVRYRLGSP
jgi:hypothetical protein